MNRKYDVFEKFSDGSSLWRACVLGLQGTHLHLRELAQKSENRFYAIAHANGKTVHPNLANIGMELMGPRKPVKRSRSAAA
jgi:hypothetical protein